MGFGAESTAASSEVLPGPGYDLPVDLDGDGRSTFGDKYALNIWLRDGGRLGDALEHGIVRGAIIDVSAFFSSSDAALAPESPLAAERATAPVVTEERRRSPSIDRGGVIALGATTASNAPHFTRRLPSQATNSDLVAASQNPRITPDGRFIVFSTAVDLLDIGTPTNVRQIYRLDRGAGGAMNILLVSVDSSGDPSTMDCDHPSISDDGERIIFETDAELEPNDTNGFMDIYLRDLRELTPRTVALTARLGDEGEEESNGDSFAAAISGNGNVIAFTSRASNFVTPLVFLDMNDDVEDVLRLEIDDVDSPETLAAGLEFMSLNNADAQSSAPMSTTGDLPGNGCPTPISESGVGQVLNRDGTKILMHGTPCDWSQDDGGTLFNLSCPDHRGVCRFDECPVDCTGIHAPCAQAAQQVYLREHLDDVWRTYLVSRAWREVDGTKDPSGHQFSQDGNYAGDACSRRASISPDGTRIAFSSLSRNFRDEPGTSENDGELDSDTREDVFFIDVAHLRDVTSSAFCTPYSPCPPETGTNPVRVSCTIGNVNPDGDSFYPMLSENGDRIIYISSANNLLADESGNSGTLDVFVRVVEATTVQCGATTCCEHDGESYLFSVSSSGTAANSGSGNPALVADGRVAVYHSTASNLLGSGTDTNNLRDVFETFAPQGDFERGDANGDGEIDISDATFTLNFLNFGEGPPICLDAADADDSGVINITDPILIVNYLFHGGPAPEPPFPDCGADDFTSPGDGLTCAGPPCS